MKDEDAKAGPLRSSAKSFIADEQIGVLVRADAHRLAEQARAIHQISRTFDLEELRVYFDELCKIVEELATIVSEVRK